MIIEIGDTKIQANAKALRSDLLDAVSVLSFLGEPPTVSDGGKGSEIKALHALSLIILDKARACFPSSPPPLLQLLLRSPKPETEPEARAFYQTAKAITLFLLRAGDSDFNVKSLYTPFNEKSIDKPRPQTIATSQAPSPSREIGRYLLLQISSELARPLQLSIFLKGGRGGGFSVSAVDAKKALRKKNENYYEIFLFVEPGVESEHIIKTMVRNEIMKGFTDLTPSYIDGEIGSFEVRYSEWIKTGKVYYRIDSPGQQLTKIPPLAARVKKT